MVEPCSKDTELVLTPVLALRPWSRSCSLSNDQGMRHLQHYLTGGLASSVCLWNFHMGFSRACVPISQGCCNKPLEICWLQTAAVDSLTVLEARNTELVLLVRKKVHLGLHPQHPEGSGESLPATSSVGDCLNTWACVPFPLTSAPWSYYYDFSVINIPHSLVGTL